MSDGTSVPSLDLTPGQTVMDLLLAQLPDATRAALQRCALAASFDEWCYDAILRGPDGPPLADLLTDHRVDRLEGSPGYQLLPTLRAAAWSRWWVDAGAAPGSNEVPATLGAFGCQYGAWAQAHDRPAEAVRGFLVGDQKRAAAVLRRAYDEAEDAMDLPHARDLLLPLSEDPLLTPLLGSELAVMRNDLLRRLQIRSMWRNAYTAGARYLHRPQVEAELIALLNDDGQNAVRLQASGGMGKSTTLAWFIAHHCVPAGIPCALVDLDWADPVTLSRHPWLMLLEIAAQLGDQMSGSPFLELLREYGTYRGADAHTGTDLLSSPTIASDGNAIESRIHEILAEGPRDVPVLVVIDTIEEAMLRAAAHPAELLASLGRLMASAPQVRVIVSGRRTHSEEQFDAHFGRLPPGGTTHLEMPHFTEAEATAYLTEVRGIADPEIVSAVVRRAETQPWQLALCADCVIDNPGITAAEVEQLDPALAWCIDRVVGRIHSDAVQWLVRYAVLLRRLRRDVAEAVLLPRIIDAMRGTADDDPDLDGRAPGSTQVFRRGLPPISPGAFDGVWNDLLAYAATSSWVSMRSDDVVVLLPAVVEPLRKLLAGRPVSRHLHADFAAYYEQRAQIHGPHRTEWQREALYHRFQLDGADAAPTWLAMIEEAHRGNADVDAVRAIAGEVLGPDYLDDDHQPRIIADGRPVVDDRVLAIAQLELAWALATQARDDGRAGSHQVWGQVESSLNEVAARWVELLELENAKQLGFRGRFALAALHLARGRAGRAVATIRLPSDIHNVDAEMCRALLVCGEALDELGRRTESIRVLTGARELARSRGDLATAARAARALGVATEHEGHYDQALVWTRQGGGRDLLRKTALRTLAAGLPAGVLGLGTVAAIGIGAAVALAALGRSRAATDAFDKMLAAERVPRPETAIPAARARAELLDIDRALGGLLQAREACLSRQDLDGAVACSAEAVRIQLRHVGNIDQAEQYLDEGMRISTVPGGDSWTSIQLSWVELNAMTGHQDRAVQQCATVLEALTRAGAPRARQLSAAVCGLVSTHDERFVTAVCAHLAAMSPASAGLAALADLAYMDTGATAIELPIGPLPTDVDPQDEAWAAVRMAEVHRIAGRSGAAIASLTRGTRELERDDSSVWWTWLRGMERIGPAQSSEFTPPALPNDLPPLLLAAYDVTLGLRRFAIDDLALAKEREQRARVLITKLSRVTQWHARLHDLATRIADTEHDSEGALLSRDTAAATRRMLGVDPTDPGADGGPNAIGTATELAITLTCERDSVRITGAATPIEGVDPAFAAAVRDLVATGSTSILVKYLVRAMHERLPLGGLPDLDDRLTLLGRDPADVRLIVATPRMAQVPWEWLRTSQNNLATDPSVSVLYRTPRQERTSRRVQVAALQRALLRTGSGPLAVDGLVGRKTEAATREFQQSAGVIADGIAGPDTWTALAWRLRGLPSERQPHVVVLEPEAWSELNTIRGHAVTGPGLPSQYARERWRVTIVRAGTFEDYLGSSASQHPTDVVHISGTMDATSTLPHLSLGGPYDGGGSSPEGLPVTLLNRLVQQQSVTGTVPLVVLDVATPPRDSELVRQLLARNDFADQLIGLGVVETVLATGLEGPGNAVQLVNLLTSGHRVARLAAALNQRHKTWPGRAPVPTAALFSSLRSYMMGTLPKV